MPEIAFSRDLLSFDTHIGYVRAKTEKVDFCPPGSSESRNREIELQDVKIAKNDFFDLKMPEIAFSRDLLSFDTHIDYVRAKTEKFDFRPPGSSQSRNREIELQGAKIAKNDFFDLKCQK